MISFFFFYLIFKLTNYKFFYDYTKVKQSIELLVFNVK